MEGIIRKKFKIYGRVQGVGFRFRARMIASSLGVTGWVENKTDGSVEMEAQGSQRQLDELLIALNKSDYIVMDRIESKEIEVKKKEKSFGILRDW